MGIIQCVLSYINDAWMIFVLILGLFRHGKDPMDGIDGTIKNLVYREVLSGDIAIDTSKKISEFDDKKAMQIVYSYQKEQLLKQP